MSNYVLLIASARTVCTEEGDPLSLTVSPSVRGEQGKSCCKEAAFLAETLPRRQRSAYNTPTNTTILQLGTFSLLLAFSNSYSVGTTKKSPRVWKTEDSDQSVQKLASRAIRGLPHYKTLNSPPSSPAQIANL